MTSDGNDVTARLSDWFAERLPADWRSGPLEVEVDREEALVVIPLRDAMNPGSFRDATRAQRIELAQQAEELFGRKVSWGTSSGGWRQLFTTTRAGVTVALAMTERQVLDSLVASGVAADRCDAAEWCIRLVGQHESDWLRDLRDGAAAAPSRRPDRPVAI
jgi:hypothetical protein